MPIPIETLNAQLVAREAHTGVYKNRQARIAIVVKVDKHGRVFYLHLSPEYTIVLEHAQVENFLRDFPVELYHYPVLMAVRKYARFVRYDSCRITDEARKVINAILTK